jgi:hypothetical protein
MPEFSSDIGISDLSVQSNNWRIAIEIRHDKVDSARDKTDVSLNNCDIVQGVRSEYVNGRHVKMINQAFIQKIKKNYAKNLWLMVLTCTPQPLPSTALLT